MHGRRFFEGLECRRICDAVDIEFVGSLELHKGLLGVASKAAIDLFVGGQIASTHEQLLQLGHAWTGVAAFYYVRVAWGDRGPATITPN